MRSFVIGDTGYVGQSFPDKKHQEVVRAVDDLLLQRPAKNEYRW